MKITANEFVMPIRPNLSAHASRILPLDNGEVYCVFFYGTAEGNDDVRVFGSLRNNRGVWSDPVPLSEDDGIPHWNPVLFRRRDGSVILFYKVGKTIAQWYTRIRISRDNCRTWEDSCEMIPGDTSGGRGPVRNSPVYLSDGSILAPGSTEQGEWKCFFDRSCDEGLTWIRSKDVRLPAELLSKYNDLTSRGIIQPTLWKTEAGVHALMRSSEGYIYRTDSPDGTDWSIPYAIDMPNNNSGIDAVKLPDGRIVLACNPVSDNWGRRTPLSLYISEDNGFTFSLLTHLVTCSRGGYAYPALQYADGRLHISYTWDRETVCYVCLEDL